MEVLVGQNFSWNWVNKVVITHIARVKYILILTIIGDALTSTLWTISKLFYSL